MTVLRGGGSSRSMNRWEYAGRDPRDPPHLASPGRACGPARVPIRLAPLGIREESQMTMIPERLSNAVWNAVSEIRHSRNPEAIARAILDELTHGSGRLPE